MMTTRQMKCYICDANTPYEAPFDDNTPCEALYEAKLPNENAIMSDLRLVRKSLLSKSYFDEWKISRAKFERYQIIVSTPGFESSGIAIVALTAYWMIPRRTTTAALCARRSACSPRSVWHGIKEQIRNDHAGWDRRFDTKRYTRVWCMQSHK